MSEIEICPYCGGNYKRLASHLPHCKEKPEEEVSAERDAYMKIEVEAPDEPCPYLIVIAGSACSTCRGASCMASKDKKISDPDYCRIEWQECLIYHDAVAQGIRTVCPYLGSPPEGRHACRGLWCYAKDYGLGGVVKSVKRCRQWSVCGRYLESKSAGVVFHRRKL